MPEPSPRDGELNLRCPKEFMDERFIVPSYQRGYRWTELEVRALLDDLREFARSDDLTRESFYCLQPVVLRKVQGRDEERERYEVIDGQQRLTTIRLLLTYLKSVGLYRRLEPYTIEYATRPQSAEALERPGEIDADANIDYHHLRRAYDAIVKWFDDSGSDTLEQQIGGVLLNPPEDGKHLRVIWYEPDDHERPIDLFVRLNIGRIPLTNAELIRALLLNGKNFKTSTFNTDSEELPPSPDRFRPYEIAQQWDDIERQLQDDRYWHFLQGVNAPPPSRIELLFELLVRIEGVPIPDQRYGVFFAYSKLAAKHRSRSGAYEAGALWWPLKRLSMRLREWFADRRMLHLVGLLVYLRSASAAAETKGDPRGAALTVLVETLARSEKQGRPAVRAALRDQLRIELFGEALLAHSEPATLGPALLERLDSDDFVYDEGRLPKQRIRAVLLAFNVATHLRNKGSNISFPFDAFRKESWDIEHIRATMDRMPGRRDDQRKWLESVLAYLGELGEAPSPQGLEGFSEEAQTLLNAKVFDAQAFEGLYRRALRALDTEGAADDLADGGDALWNLTLLDMGTNRSIKNALFPIKRRMVLKHEREGRFVPVCTRDVFLKGYTQALGEVKNMLYWNDRDRLAYRAAMVDALTELFLED